MKHRTPSTKAQDKLRAVREAARAERDIEVAAFLDGFAALVRQKRTDPCAGSIATALEGLASSLRAGLVDDGFPAP